jgi:ribosomal protein L7/L12
MKYIVQCTHPSVPSDVNYVGPFDSELDANVYTEMPVFGQLECQRNHKILEMYTPKIDNVPFGKVVDLIEQAENRGKQLAITEMARESKPFGVGMDGRIEDDLTIIQQFGIVNPIRVIKELRIRYPGLSLQNAKEIVEDWHARSDVTTPLFGK